MARERHGAAALCDTLERWSRGRSHAYRRYRRHLPSRQCVRSFRRRGAVQERHLDPHAAFALRPLRWIAEEDLIYDHDSRTLHRPTCALAHRTHGSRLPAGSALELVWAPRMCECGPDVTLALGRS